MKQINTKQTFYIGITLFSMFFGAGNLIFAPFLGAQAGLAAPLALAGFLCTAVILPIATILILSLYKNAVDMISTISPGFAKVFVTLIYLLIGPCIAIPRTASTSYEMFGWLFPLSLGSRILYTLLFFSACSLTALHPGKLKDVLGKIMGPILVALIILVCAGSASLPAQIGSIAPAYSHNSFLVGFNEGYQTMDILAAFCFGIVILLNIQQMGITDRKIQRKILNRGAMIAGILLAALYTMLAVTGMLHSKDLQSLNNGAQILSSLTGSVYGSFGQIINSAIFLAACYNVCSGLLSCCAEYFTELSGQKLSYRSWLAFFTVAGALLACFGLDAILAISAPILSWICPLAIGLLAYGLVRYLIMGRKKARASR